MTDALDRLASTAAPLLRRVDAALGEAGAGAADPLWPLLRKVRALPSDAVAAVAGWRHEPLEAAVEPLRALPRRHTEALAGLPAHPPWQGAGAEAYAAVFAALRGHVSGPDGASLAGRLADTARYLEETARWVTRSRRALALALGESLGSAEAVTLVTGAGPPGPAAARIAAHVLAVVATACDEGQHLHDEWHPRLPELAFLPPRVDSPAPGATVRVGE